MLLGAPSIEFLTRITPRMIYGTIILGAVVGSLGSPLPRNVVVIVTVFVSLQAVSIANAYAQTIRDDMAGRQVTPWRSKWKVIFTPSWVVGSTAVPIACFGLAMLGVIGQDTALRVTKVGLIVILAASGFVARRLSGARVLPSIWAGAMVALLGYGVVQIKLWTKYLPEIGS